MTPRERLLTTLEHREPDRIPIDLASTQVTGISVLAYKNLLKFLGLPEENIRICDGIQQICIPSDTILHKFGVDTRGVWPITSHINFTDEDTGTYLSHYDEWGLGYRKSKEGLWYDLFFSPLSGKLLSPQIIETYPWPVANNPERFKGLREQALEYRRAGYAVVLKSICAGNLEMAIRLRGMEDILTDLLIDPENAGRLLDAILQVKLTYWEKALDELGDVVDVVAEADDFGTQESQLISPEIFRTIIKPRQVELIKFLKKRKPEGYVFFHSCGNVSELLPDFIDMGIDILNPVHFTAKGMNPKKLKEDFGEHITFWGGGVDTQETLPHGTPNQVRDEVKRNIEIFAPGGGFVFNTVHNIQADVPPENIMAMYETLYEFANY
jgi:uroporphyrinogen decarboxylase